MPRSRAGQKSAWCLRRLSSSIGSHCNDQGALQQPRRKPTCWWSNFPMVMELDSDGLRDKLDGHEPWPEDISTALRLSRSTAPWVPMLEDVIIRSIHELPLPQQQLRRDVPELKAMGLTAEEPWYLHIMAGHIPYRNDCLQCQVGAGRNRPRTRQKFQSTYEMCVDVAGSLRKQLIKEEQRQSTS